jgi:hypothetical protein
LNRFLRFADYADSGTYRKIKSRMTNSNCSESVRALLSEIVDYAGLFPPSQLSMPDAVNNYANYKNSNYNWMLGRFVVSMARLDEFSDNARNFLTNSKFSVWKLSVLASDDISETIRQIEDFNAANAPFAVCDSIEAKAVTTRMIEEITEFVQANFVVYFELPLNENLADLVSAVAKRGQRAKIRTGGITENAFPKNEKIIHFMKTCLAANIPFKATAGLHHPLRCRKPLTYDKDAPTGTMNGFLNVFLAAGFLRQGFQESLISELLEDERAENFTFNAGGVLWRQEYFISTAQLKILRDKSIISFGSCSFEEPIADLKEIGIL